jgi:hypothetical protein
MKIKNYLTQEINWKETGKAEYPYQAVCDGQKMLIRINDFPAEHLYTLLAGDKEIGDFDDWSAVWNRPQQTAEAEIALPKKKTSKRIFVSVKVSEYEERRRRQRNKIIRGIRAEEIRGAKANRIFSKLESTSKSDSSPPENQRHVKNEK